MADKKDKKVRAESALTRMDFTLSFDRKMYEDLTRDETINRLTEVCEELEEVVKKSTRQYAFQLECPPDSENWHIQGRFRLARRQRLSTVKRYFKVLFGDTFYFSKFSPTSNACQNFNYVLKRDTRQAGPWSTGGLSDVESTIMRDCTLKIWQKFLINEFQAYSAKRCKHLFYRAIWHIHDPKGGSGKSSFKRWLLFNYPEDVGLINPFGTPTQIQSSLYKLGSKKLYILDLPRSYRTKKDHYDEKTGRVVRSTYHYHRNYADLMLVIEDLKDAILQDTMYGKGGVTLIPNPMILIFSNWPLEPEDDTGLFISRDRIQTLQVESEQVSESHDRFNLDLSLNRKVVPDVPAFLKKLIRNEEDASFRELSATEFAAELLEKGGD